MDDLPDDAPHRDVDLAILEADRAGILDAYFVIPSTVWGKPIGLVFDQGISNTWGTHIPGLIMSSFNRGTAGYLGKGANPS